MPIVAERRTIDGLELEAPGVDRIKTDFLCSQRTGMVAAGAFTRKTSTLADQTTAANASVLFNASFLERLVDRLVHLFPNLIDAEASRPLARRVINESLEESGGFHSRNGSEVGVFH